MREQSIQVNEDFRFQQRAWVVQRVGWWLMGALLVAALAGVFGSGPLSDAQIADPDQLVRLKYPRFQRLQGPSTFEISLSPAAISGGKVAIRINDELAQATRVQRIEPQPRAVRALADGIEYEFVFAEPGHPATVRLFVEAEKAGAIDAQLGLAGHPPLVFTSFVYP